MRVHFKERLRVSVGFLKEFLMLIYVSLLVYKQDNMPIVIEKLTIKFH